MTVSREDAKVPVTLSEVEGIVVESGEELRHRSRQLQLAVGVANGAGFTAVAAKILDLLAGSASAGASIVSIIFPSAVLFAMGMAVIGLSAFLDVILAALRLQHVHRVRIAVEGGVKAKKTVAKWTIVEAAKIYGLEGLAGLLFMAGATYPLMVLAARYSAAPGFTW